MFHQGIAGTFFAELASVQGSVPTCAQCGKPLSKKISHPHYYDRSHEIISFWSIKCPSCSTSHIIFNSTVVLPIMAPVASGLDSPKPDPGDTTQPSLFA